MKHYSVTLLASLLIASPTLRANPATTPSTQPALAESTPVVKDGVSVTMSPIQQTISTDEQPRFVVRFSNTGGDYINLYDVGAYWDWRFEFARKDKQSEQPGPWVLRMASIIDRHRIEHRQIKAGENTEVAVDLNDPPFTFDFVYGGLVKHLVAPVRHLSAGTYQMTITIALQNPFGPGFHEWTGPLTTEPVELVVRQPLPKEITKPTPQEIVAYDEAIHRMTANLQPDGLWQNGVSPDINLPKNATAEDVIDAAVNQTVLASKEYRVLRMQPFSSSGLPRAVSGSAALLQVGQSFKVLIFFPYGNAGWWTRFYDTTISLPATRPVASE